MKCPVNIILPVFWLNVLLVPVILAGPPFITDDPDPTDYRHWEAYLFTTGDYHYGNGYSLDGPAAELDYGALPDTQLSLGIGMASVGGDGMQTASGVGDAALSVKYRFLHGTDGWPELALFPGLTLPTGDADRGLGNGRATCHLPLWAQKSFGSWTVDAGGGVFFTSVPGNRDYPYGGLLLQRDWGEHLSLGGELVAQGQDVDGDHGFAALNFGGSYRFNGLFSVQATLGHSVFGDEHTLWYFGFYWNW